MDFQKTYQFMHRLGRTCLNCESWRCHRSLLCPDCEERFLERQNLEATSLVLQGKSISCTALYDWVENKNRCLSLLIKQLKGGQLPEASFFWGERLALLALKKHRTGKKFLLVPAPAKNPNRKDHAYQLAAAISQLTGWPVHQGLRREALPFKQTEAKLLGRAQRSKIRITNHEKITSQTCVIFVDDVVTTGSTAMAAYRALGVSRPFEIWCLAKRGELAAAPLF